MLFNRSYEPIWQRTDGVVTAADPTERVVFSAQRWFYDDGDLQHVAALCRCLEEVLAAFRNGTDVARWLLPNRDDA